MNAIVLSIGTELTSGQTIDTNSAYLARQLAERGISTLEHITVADDQPEIADAIRRSAAKADLVIVSGGLGPTADDLTRQALADAMGTTLEMDDKCLAEITEFFRLRNRPMSPVNQVQAMVPRGATAIPNKVGTAPGLYARIGRCDVFITPGVPSEMEWMYKNAVEPRLPSLSGVIVHRILHTFGAGESDVGAKIADLMKRGANPLVGTTVAAGLVSIRIIACAATVDEARRMTDGTVAAINERLGELVVGEGDMTMAQVVGELLRKRRQTLATAESCTGGLVGKLITDVSGSSDYYLGGVVSYSNRIKAGLLGVEEALLERHGAVSEPVARAMAEGCRKRLGSDWALAITGVAGPTGGTAEKPVGLVHIALAGPHGTEAIRSVFPGTREIVRLRSALMALNLLRLRLRGQ
ncbi:MAG: competence/damage-inducible protein A [Phycisphaerae bacterium]